MQLSLYVCGHFGANYTVIQYFLAHSVDYLLVQESPFLLSLLSSHFVQDHHLHRWGQGPQELHGGQDSLVPPTHIPRIVTRITPRGVNIPKNPRGAKIPYTHIMYITPWKRGQYSQEPPETVQCPQGPGQ